MKRKIIRLAVLAITLSLLAGCAGNVSPTLPPETVENLFDVQPTPPQTESGESGTEPTKPPTASLGSFAMGFDDRSQQNEMGPYLVYEGGEMHIGFHFNIMGSLGNDGVGLMLILDGKPQPYRTAEDEAYCYLHTFYPPTAEGGKVSMELIFTPVTGASGDNLLLEVFHLIEPDYNPADEIKGFRVTNGSTSTDTQVIFHADPPASDRLNVTERVAALSVQQVDLTTLDIWGWSAQDLQTKYSFKYQIDAPQDSNLILNVQQGSQLHYHAEVFSPGIVEWSLLLYIDNQPASVLPDNEICFNTPNGKKAVIDITLDMTDYEEGSPLYAVLVARNARDPRVFDGTACHTDITITRFITCEESFTDWLKKYYPDSPELEESL